MRIFLAGATGIVGVRLVPLFVAAGHEVTGMTRTEAKIETLEALGAAAVFCDVYDVERLTGLIARSAPDLVMDQLTDLPDDIASLPGHGEANSRIRIEGTRNLVAAAEAGGAERFIAQSIAWDPGGTGTEARRYLESTVLGIGGVVLRYGMFYGPGTYYESGTPPPPSVAIDEAARRTFELLGAESGIFEIVDP